MSGVFVHPRVLERHPDLEEKDVISAWRNALQLARRDSNEAMYYIAVGSDANGRLVEMVAMASDDGFLIYHAMTPPSKKTMKELRLRGRRGR